MCGEDVTDGDIVLQISQQGEGIKRCREQIHTAPGHGYGVVYVFSNFSPAANEFCFVVFSLL